MIEQKRYCFREDYDSMVESKTLAVRFSGNILFKEQMECNVEYWDRQFKKSLGNVTSNGGTL